MRRFSQRNSLVTLSDINITPLLDLAFVLLIIFVIISPSIRSAQEHGMELNLPKGGKADRPFDPKDAHLVEINPQGRYMLDQRPMVLAKLKSELLVYLRSNPNIFVMLRADAKGEYGPVVAFLDFCQNNGIPCNLRTEGGP